MTKYRLKKDTPFYKKGTELCEDWFHKGVLLNDDCYAVANLNELDNPDEWFEEVKEPKKEPTWVRKQIKQIEFGKHKLVWVVVRFIKNQSYICYDDEFGDTIDCNEPGEIRRINFHADDSEFWRQKDYDTLNQMVRDGYIEIEDNPNIVWEDEDAQS